MLSSDKRVQISSLLAVVVFLMLSTIAAVVAFSGPNAQLFVRMKISEKGMAQMEFTPTTSNQKYGLRPFFLRGSNEMHDLAFLIPSKEPLNIRFYPLPSTGPVPVTGTIEKVWVRSRWLHKEQKIPLEAVASISGFKELTRDDKSLHFELAPFARFPCLEINLPFESTNELGFFPANRVSHYTGFILFEGIYILGFVGLQSLNKRKGAR
jgi:hypothetical protein